MTPAEAVHSTIGYDPDDPKWDAFATAARMLAMAGDLDAAVAVLDELPDWPRADACYALAHALDEDDQPALAVRVWLPAFSDPKRTSRTILFEGLKAAAGLSALGGNEVLQRLCLAVVDLERWWRPARTESAGE